MNTPPMNDLDDILARSAPQSSADAPALESAIGALVDEARATTTARGRRSTRPWLIAGTILGAGVLAGGAAYGASVLTSSGPWSNLTDEAEATATRFEWQVTLPDGTECVSRLTGVDLTPAQVEVVENALSDPGELLALDRSRVRAEFLAQYDASNSQQEIADRQTWRSWIDAGYESVAALDSVTGRGEVEDSTLDVIPGSAENEVFLHTSMRIIVDGITAQGVDAMTHLAPETACEAGQ